MALLKCKECKKKIAVDADSCPKCGTKTPFELVDCTNKKCDAKLPKGINKCPVCKKDQATLSEILAGVVVLAIIVVIAVNIFSDDADSGDKAKTPEANLFIANKDKTVQTIRDLSSHEKTKVYKAFFVENEAILREVGEENAIACLSDNIQHKSTELTLQKMGQWCLDAVKQKRNFAQYVNYEKFEEFFSAWDGSYRPLVKLAKAAMNNPDSFDHVSTTYRISKRDDGAVGFVRMQYRGTNVYNAIVTNSVLVQVDPATGEITKVVEEN